MDCVLYGLAKSKKGANRTTAIRRYCQWCMNGSPVNQCASPDCIIYQYRASYKGVLNVRFLPEKHIINDNGGSSNSKKAE